MNYYCKVQLPSCLLYKEIIQLPFRLSHLAYL